MVSSLGRNSVQEKILFNEIFKIYRSYLYPLLRKMCFKKGIKNVLIKLFFSTKWLFNGKRDNNYIGDCVFQIYVFALAVIIGGTLFTNLALFT